MSQNQKIILKKSAIADKTPTEEQLDYGEIAINYASGKEFISLKNADNQIVKITPSSEPLFRYDNESKNGIVPTSLNNGCQAKGLYSFAEGFATQALNLCSHAEGQGTIASGNISHVEGINTKALSEICHAEGNSTVASGVCSHAEGYNTTTNGNYSHAEGQRTIANGNSSHAEGISTIASGDCSHAEGLLTKTTNTSEHASGQFNISTQLTGYGDVNYSLFTIGNGDTESSRHNAFEVKKSGEIFIQKDKVNTSEMVSLQDKLTSFQTKIDNLPDTADLLRRMTAMETQLAGINELLNKIIGES